MIRVASVPEAHLYVRHLSHPDGADPVVRLADPVPADGAKAPGGWWPPLMLDPEWIARNHEHFDVFHVHFGFDAISTDTLHGIVDELTRRGKPLVYTVHDLRNPHQRDAGPHDKQLDVLVRAADALITLTPGAAEVIRARWGRSATVHPHPHVLDPARIRRRRPPSRHFVVGVHVKSVRANMDPFPVLDTLAEAVRSLDDATLQVNLHDEMFEPGNHFYAPRTAATLLAYAQRPDVDVRVHPYFTEDQLWKYLCSLSASVLPYRFGTHSGWLEACFDLGTAVIAPSCGFYGQQRQCEVFDYTETRFDAASLQRAVRVVYERVSAGVVPPRATWPLRRAERRDLSLAHAALYERILA